MKHILVIVVCSHSNPIEIVKCSIESFRTTTEEDCVTTKTQFDKLMEDKNIVFKTACHPY